MNKKQIQEALARVDNALAQLNINRQGHIILTNDMKSIQYCCMEYFADELVIKDLENERADVITVHSEPNDEDSEGSGDSV